MSTPQPPKGQMVLYSSATPPLQDGPYKLTVETDVAYNAADHTADAPPGLMAQDYYFDVVGPRFAVPPAMVAGVFPPRNAHGSFQDDLPHIVLGRRTLPWERPLGAAAQIPAVPIKADGAPALTDPFPWVALLLFEEGEYTLLHNIPLDQAVPNTVFAALGSPSGITCDAVEASASLIAEIMPSYEELQLLVHVRQVNTDDRELNAYGGDGFFSVVVGNRLPSPNAQCRAVLVSLEQRLDLIPADSNAVAAPLRGLQEIVVLQDAVPRAFLEQTVQQRANLPANAFTLSKSPVNNFASATFTGSFSQAGFALPKKARLVALTSWQFTCEGPGTFRELMQGLDVAMFGTVKKSGQPSLTDTGHLPMTLQDRAGISEEVLYRGPLAQLQLTRDPLGPYHSADQARRVSPETGTEDISYAAAFEVGRLLAAADGRLAQSLMRWRRGSFKQSARASTILAANLRINLALPATLADKLHTPIAPRAASRAAAAVSLASLPAGDPYRTKTIANLPGLVASELATAWQITPAAAATMLGDPGTLGTEAATPVQTVRVDTTLAAEAADKAGLSRLSAARAELLDTTKTLLGGI
jgi:hypothetical protein